MKILILTIFFSCGSIALAESCLVQQFSQSERSSTLILQRSTIVELKNLGAAKVSNDQDGAEGSGDHFLLEGVLDKDLLILRDFSAEGEQQTEISVVDTRSNKTIAFKLSSIAPSERTPSKTAFVTFGFDYRGTIYHLSCE